MTMTADDIKAVAKAKAIAMANHHPHPDWYADCAVAAHEGKPIPDYPTPVENPAPVAEEPIAES